jgi:hypothetical protein
MHLTVFSRASILTAYIGPRFGSYARVIVPILASGSLAY